MKDAEIREKGGDLETSHPIQNSVHPLAHPLSQARLLPSSSCQLLEAGRVGNSPPKSVASFSCMHVCIKPELPRILQRAGRRRKQIEPTQETKRNKLLKGRLGVGQ